MVLRDFIIVVSGIPRSGTSMMMRILEAGGLDVVTDNIRKADLNNPKGYYETEKTKKLKTDSIWIKDYKGKVIKIISQLIYNLPVEYYYKIIFMKRNMDEIIASQSAMIKNLGSKDPEIPKETLAARFNEHLERVGSWLIDQKNMEVLYISYNEMVANPKGHIPSVNRFLGGCLDEAEMAGAVEAALYRQRFPD